LMAGAAAFGLAAFVVMAIGTSGREAGSGPVFVRSLLRLVLAAGAGGAADLRQRRRDRETPALDLAVAFRADRRALDAREFVGEQDEAAGASGECLVQSRVNA
jgi:hypothetical protein